MSDVYFNSCYDYYAASDVRLQNRFQLGRNFARTISSTVNNFILAKEKNVFAFVLFVIV